MGLRHHVKHITKSQATVKKYFEKLEYNKAGENGRNRRIRLSLFSNLDGKLAAWYAYCRLDRP